MFDYYWIKKERAKEMRGKSIKAWRAGVNYNAFSLQHDVRGESKWYISRLMCIQPASTLARYIKLDINNI